MLEDKEVHKWFHVDGWLPLATSNGNDADCGQPELGRERVLRLGQVIGYRAGRGGYGAGPRGGLEAEGAL